MTLVICKHCQKQFKTKPCWLKLGYGKYCSSACQYAARKNGKMVPCFICGKETYKQKKRLSNTKSKKFFCGKSCQAIWRNQVFRGPNHANWKDGAHVDYRDIMRKNHVTAVCKLCKMKDPRVLCVHHRDENRQNNTLANLVWLCYNCHRLAHQYRVKIP